MTAIPHCPYCWNALHRDKKNNVLDYCLRCDSSVTYCFWICVSDSSITCVEKIEFEFTTVE